MRINKAEYIKKETFVLNPSFATTRMVTQQIPKIENKPEEKLETVLFLPKGEGRKGEGGLRTQGYFKISLPDKPLVTVITVVFNGRKHLEETILSVINQTYNNVEYIIIDGGATDGTLDIIRKYEHAIDYWVSEPDGGIYDAMNKGIQLCSGDFVNFLNCGDYYASSEALKSFVSGISSLDSVYFARAIIEAEKDSISWKLPGEDVNISKCLFNIP